MASICTDAGFNMDSPRATEIQHQAGQGDVFAQYNLGVAFYNGIKGFPKNYSKALKWFKKAAEQGEAEALFSIGFMFLLGEGVEQNHHEAATWFTKAVEMGNTDAMVHLAHLYYMGEGVDFNLDKAIVLMTKAAKLGNLDAQESLSDWLL